MYLLLKGQVAVITGAGAGIGKSTALRLAEQGAHVIASDIDRDTARRTADAIIERGGKARAVTADVGERAQVFELMDYAVSEFGALDIVVNNAAAVLSSPIIDMDEQTWQQLLRVTLSGAFYGTQAALRIMVGQRTGVIINIASAAAMAGEPGLGGYAAAKAGVVSLSKTAAVECGCHGIRINAVLPGATATAGLVAAVEASGHAQEEWTRQIPSARFGQPEEVADAVLFLASSLSNYINGTTLVIDGGVAARSSSPRFNQ